MAGNATLTLFDGTSNTDYDIWLVALSTATNNQFMTQQTHTGLWWSPIRRAESFINFTCVWPLVGSSLRVNNGYAGIDPHNGFDRMNRLQDAVRAHQMQVIGGQTTNPMTLTYINNDARSPIFNSLISNPGELTPLIYSGWIRSVEKQFDKAKNVFYTNYTMNILTHPSPDASVVPSTVNNSITYAPTAADQNLYGKSWVGITGLASQIPKVAL
jgi:hypothetical protein